jgi:hypothetical protein
MLERMMKPWLMPALIGVLLLSSGGGACAEDKFGRLTVQEVQQKLTQKNVFLFDNNARSRWQKGHVPGAKWLDPGDYAESELPSDKSATLVFYCANEH